MKIDYVLLGSTNNPTYLDFWPIVSKIWKLKFNITPVLGLIGEHNLVVSEEYGKVIRFNELPNWESGLLSQLVRLYLPKYLKGNCLISDIDMFPLSKKYFIDDLEKYTDDEFIIMSSHHPQTIDMPQYPMCYVVANSELFTNIFELNKDWDLWIEDVPKNDWYTDQMYLYSVVNNNKNINYVFPKRSFINDRIDRGDWYYDVNKLLNGEYIDCHSLRPYNNHKNEIDKLLNLI
jgi:hypothetical protein